MDKTVNTFAHTDVAIVIKALNEERNIERAVVSALAAAPGLSLVVVLADSGSNDRTVEIASRYDIRIVQLADFTEKSCGIGAQLGYQFVDCDYVYILDGDMEIFPDFIPAAVAQLAADPRLAGVGGLVEEHGSGNYEFDKRLANADGAIAGDVEALDMGGLYRRTAIDAAGYLTNRNLHSYEEKELALRLRRAGFRLVRLPIPAVRHFGKTETTRVLLLKRWKTRHLDGPGEIVRAAIGRPGWMHLLGMFWRQIAVSNSWVLAIGGLIAAPVSALPLLVVVLFHAALYARFLMIERSLGRATMAYVNMQVLSASFIRGLLASPTDPAARIRSNVVK